MGGRIAHSFCYEVVHDGVVKDDEDEGEVVADDAESLLILFYPAPEASVAIRATSENDDGDGERDTPCDSVIHTFVGFYAAPLFAHKNLKNVVRDNRGPKKRTHVENWVIHADSVHPNPSHVSPGWSTLLSASAPRPMKYESDANISATDKNTIICTGMSSVAESTNTKTQ